MSVKVHEAFCLDSLQDRLFWKDHFFGDKLQDEWSEGGTGSAAVVDLQAGGIVRLITGATINNEYHIQWGENPNEIRSLLVTKQVTIEFLVLLASVDNVEAHLSLYYDGTHFVRFRFDSGASNNWLIETDDGTGPTSADSGEAADTGYHVFRIECFPTGEVNYYIDGDPVANSPITADIPTEHLMPRIYVETLTNAIKTLDLNYVGLRQEI